MKPPGKISFITTIYNEGKEIDKLLDSLLLQSKKPDEIVIVDGGSRDDTIGRIKNYELRIKREKVKFKLLIKKGNRSVGRNEAIKAATGDIIVASDAGCILDKDWIKRITKPFDDTSIDVVAGYYKGISENIFQKCLIPYVLVMPDRVNPEDFLPSSRSVAFRKKVWEKAGGYPTKLDTCEDLVFARTLKRMGFHFAFAREAIVYWQQRRNLKEAFLQFFSYAKGDGKAFYIRPQTPFLFLRYAVGILAVIYYFITQSTLILTSLFLILLLYILWSIRKNYRYVNDWHALYLLPLLQFTADFAVMSGFISGLL